MAPADVVDGEKWVLGAERPGEICAAGYVCEMDVWGENIVEPFEHRGRKDHAGRCYDAEAGEVGYLTGDDATALEGREIFGADAEVGYSGAMISTCRSKVR